MSKSNKDSKSGGFTFNAPITGTNQQFNQGGHNTQQNAETIQNTRGGTHYNQQGAAKINNNQGATFNGNVTMTAMVKYDNKLLNDMDLLSPAIKEYGVSRVMNAVLNFDSDFIDQVALMHDTDLLCAGVMSFEGDFIE
jgi:hypothetical protein